MLHKMKLKESPFEKLFRKLYSSDEEIEQKTQRMYKIYSPENMYLKH